MARALYRRSQSSAGVVNTRFCVAAARARFSRVQGPSSCRQLVQHHPLTNCLPAGE